MTESQFVSSLNKKYIVKLPNGILNKVSVFDYNLKISADKENSIIQLDDKSWNYIRNLQIMGIDEI